MSPEITTWYLEITANDAIELLNTPDSAFVVREAVVKNWRLNRFLYQLVGENWQWHDKLVWTTDDWKNYAERPELRTFVAYWHGSIAGYFELSLKNQDVKIEYFGLSPDFIGKGFGGFILSEAIRLARAWNPARLWVHTCSLDHPAALTNYQKRGFRLYKTENEAAPTVKLS
jgi:GNAT superfamily N-acetyltransferase